MLQSGTKVVLLLLLFAGLARGEKKYPEDVVVKFNSGKIKEKTKFVGYHDVETYESFYENGEKHFSFKRIEKAKETGYDVYDYREVSDKGKTLAEGRCFVSPDTDFYPPHQGCFRLTGKTFSYSENEQLLREYVLVNGQYEGEAKIYTAEKTTTLLYKKGRIVKRVEIDNKTKKTITAKEYYEDGSEKK